MDHGIVSKIYSKYYLSNGKISLYLAWIAYNLSCFLSAEIAYHIAREAEKKELVQLRLDMFGLTFAIYGAMTLFSLLVFAVEVMVGKRNKREDKHLGNQDNDVTMDRRVTENNLKGDKNEVPSLREQAEDKDNQGTTDQDENMANVLVHRGKDIMKDNDITILFLF